VSAQSVIYCRFPYQDGISTLFGGSWMIATTTLCPLSKPAAAALHDLYLKVSPPYAAVKVWDTLLNDEQRNRLGGDLEAAYLNHRTVGIVARSRHISRTCPDRHWLGTWLSTHRKQKVAVARGWRRRCSSFTRKSRCHSQRRPRDPRIPLRGVLGRGRH